jgi:4-carboxymuconolactone decarboxylase
LKLAAVIVLLLGLAAPFQVSAQQPNTARPSGPLQQKIAPGLATFTDDVLFGDVWKRPELSPRDRSLVTISVLIATGKPDQLQGHLGRALSNGVQPGEASAVLAHLALYCGWPSAVSALNVYEQVYTARKIDTSTLRALVPQLSAPGSDASRAKAVNEQFGVVAPKFAQLTNDVVFGKLWLRSDLSLRDRSLVTIAALAAMGDDDQLDLYLRRGLESCLTRSQIAEALTHLGFYAGWSRATQALTVLTSTFEQIASADAQKATPATAGRAEPAAPSSNFTGAVAVTQPFSGTGGARLGGATVTFQPGARTRWHSHPLGQLIVVTAGRGWIQIEGEPVRAMGPGDVVWTPPGTKHWHGATRTSAMTHVAVSESQEGSSVSWFEPVSEAQFEGRP